MTDTESASLLFEDAMLFTYSAALRAVAALGVADHLADGPLSPGELGSACGADPDRLGRILRLLAARGVFREDGNGRFRLTRKGEALRTDAPTSARAPVLMLTDDMFWKTSHQLATTVCDGDATFEALFGIPLARHFDDGERERLFYEGMAAVSDAEDELVATSYEFPSSGTVVDVGGRSGSLLLAVLRRNPALRGILFDRDPVPTGRPVDNGKVTDRWETVQGDFFDEVPRGDVHVLKRILHNFGDEDCVRILANCRRALAEGGRVLVVDAVIPDGNGAHQSKSMDVMMLAALTGRERTAAQLGRLFGAAGLTLERVLRTPSVMSIAEGTPS